MKTFDQFRIRQAEIAQLIVLQCLFSLKESREVFFQGGTAIRWFYGGLRFSEDLDLVSPWSSEKAAVMVDSAAEQVRRYMVANFGPGDFSLKPKKSRDGAYRAFFDFAPSEKRQKVSVKVEFEQLAGVMRPNTDKIIMQSAPAVAYFLREAGFGSAGAAVIINVETAEEILTDKMRALMERPYTKGRDFFDVWFLTKTLGVRPDPGGLDRKLSMYAVPFTEKTPAAFYAGLDKLSTGDRKALAGEIHQDLSRFIEAQTLEVLARENFRDLLSAVQEAFRLCLRTNHSRPRGHRQA
ncbi:MAG: nucleotidyl transferase AbiEii/AbiGii toxin family protein [Deltaproteobacteria bacterium]|nr:nucleotidyl transferase AbiEii/AbiGii toxin family protein [Deltaproteobacteria bacterium]